MHRTKQKAILVEMKLIMCQFCLPVPCSPLVQEPLKGGSKPRNSIGHAEAPCPSGEWELTSCSRAQFFWTSCSVKVCLIVGPMCTHLDLGNCHHTQPQLLKEIKM